jgi:hypothetical protein
MLLTFFEDYLAVVHSLEELKILGNNSSMVRIVSRNKPTVINESRYI